MVLRLTISHALRAEKAMPEVVCFSALGALALLDFIAVASAVFPRLSRWVGLHCLQHLFDLGRSAFAHVGQDCFKELLKTRASAKSPNPLRLPLSPFLITLQHRATKVSCSGDLLETQDNIFVGHIALDFKTGIRRSVLQWVKRQTEASFSFKNASYPCCFYFCHFSHNHVKVA